jgi:pimeloyl-ACP methyl ester carboxylesterase
VVKELSSDQEDFGLNEAIQAISEVPGRSSLIPPVPSGVDECWMDMDGARLRYLRAGSGPPVVLLHGLLGYSFSWRYTIPALALYATVYAPDMLGSGFSDRPPGLDCRMRAVARRLLRFVEKLGLSRFDLVGTSHGGAVAMMAAAQSLDSTAVGTPKMGRLVLVAPVNPYSAHGRWLAPFLGGSLGSALFRFTAPRATFFYGYALRRLYADPHRIPPGTLEGYMAPLAIPGLFNYGFSVVRTWTADMRELEALLPMLADVATLLIWGGDDAAVYATSGRALARHFRISQLKLLPGVGHLPYEECPGEFNSLLIEFLTGISPVG